MEQLIKKLNDQSNNEDKLLFILLLSLNAIFFSSALALNHKVPLYFFGFNIFALIAQKYISIKTLNAQIDIYQQHLQNPNIINKPINKWLKHLDLVNWGIIGIGILGIMSFCIF